MLECVVLEMRDQRTTTMGHPDLRLPIPLLPLSVLPCLTVTLVSRCIFRQKSGWSGNVHLFWWNS